MIGMVLRSASHHESFALSCARGILILQSEDGVGDHSDKVGSRYPAKGLIAQV
jgi:hypothetical protein